MQKKTKWMRAYINIMIYFLIYKTKTQFFEKRNNISKSMAKFDKKEIKNTKRKYKANKSITKINILSGNINHCVNNLEWLSEIIFVEI